MDQEYIATMANPLTVTTASRKNDKALTPLQPDMAGMNMVTRSIRFTQAPAGRQAAALSGANVILWMGHGPCRAIAAIWAFVG
jgi:hypothetical protein